uniref:SAM-dependent MTase RsmB/NOP-type domain-containing protein n=1 Tax=Arcella intermedia TaxID=1963864 RepID=A0A6B2L3Y9_9EUKA
MNNIPIQSYNIKTLNRFFRLNPKKEISKEQLCKEFGISSLDPIPWMPQFYSIPYHFKLSSLAAYKEGCIYGMDVSSGAVVKALAPEPGDNILDLCCAPGAKLSFMMDEMNHTGTITGVDISESRLSTCRTICKKYGVTNVRLFACDASSFNILAPDLNAEPIRKKRRVNYDSNQSISITNSNSNSNQSTTELSVSNSSIQKIESIQNSDTNESTPTNSSLPESQSTTNTPITTSNSIQSIDPATPSISSAQNPKCNQKKKKKKKKKRHLDDLPNLFFCNNWKMRSSSSFLYDKVLVDAPCTLDASVRHILQFNKVGWNKNQFSTDISNNITQIQKRILLNGFNLLKSGGTLVYATCSFCKNQNEDVIEWLLNTEKSASVVPITSLASSPATPGTIPSTLRFLPIHTNTSGIFIAKIQKK